MQRTYLASAGLTVALVATGLVPRAPLPAGEAAPLFGSAPLDAERFAVLAVPLGFMLLLSGCLVFGTPPPPAASATAISLIKARLKATFIAIFAVVLVV